MVIRGILTQAARAQFGQEMNEKVLETMRLADQNPASVRAIYSAPDWRRPVIMVA
jgi:hypothetical protein